MRWPHDPRRMLERDHAELLVRASRLEQVFTTTALVARCRKMAQAYRAAAELLQAEIDELEADARRARQLADALAEAQGRPKQ